MYGWRRKRRRKKKKEEENVELEASLAPAEAEVEDVAKVDKKIFKSLPVRGGPPLPLANPGFNFPWLSSCRIP